MLDANVLANALVADLLLNLAYFERLFIPLWSDEILEETRRTGSYKLHREQSRVDGFHAALLASFPNSLISGYEHWIEQCTNDASDRHVLAAGIKGRAQHIVTFNTRHFKDADLVEPWGIRAAHPDDYLLLLNAQNSQTILRQIDRMARKQRINPSELLRRIAAHAPKFSTALLS